MLYAETPSALASGAHVHVVPLFASWFCSGRRWAAPFPAGAVASRPGILLLEPHLAVTAGTEDTHCNSLLAHSAWWVLEEVSLFWLKQVPSEKQMPWVHPELAIKNSTLCAMGYKRLKIHSFLNTFLPKKTKTFLRKPHWQECYTLQSVIKPVGSGGRLLSLNSSPAIHVDVTVASYLTSPSLIYLFLFQESKKFLLSKTGVRMKWKNSYQILGIVLDVYQVFDK